MQITWTRARASDLRTGNQATESEGREGPEAAARARKAAEVWRKRSKQRVADGVAAAREKALAQIEAKMRIDLENSRLKKNAANLCALAAEKKLKKSEVISGERLTSNKLAAFYKIL